MYFVCSAYIHKRTFCRKGSLEKKLVGNYKKKASCTHQNLRKNVYKENTRALDNFSLKVFKYNTHARLGILCIYAQLHTHIEQRQYGLELCETSPPTMTCSIEIKLDTVVENVNVFNAEVSYVPTIYYMANMKLFIYIFLSTFHCLYSSEK